MKHKKILNILIEIVLIIVPLIAGVLYTVYYGRSILDIYLPNGEWNDEISYYKQIEGMVSYGIPQGFFGYNESHAQLLTFGPWNFILLIPYAIIGKIFGWKYLTPIICNLLFVIIAIAIFVKHVKLSNRRMVLITVGLISLPSVTRYILSGMCEPLNFSLVILILALIIHILQNDTINKWKIVLLYFSIFIFIFMRPYNIVFLIFAFWIMSNNNHKVKKISILWMILPTVSLILYFAFNKLFCAPYFTPIFSMDIFTSFIKEGILYGFHNLLSTYTEALKTIFSLIHSSIIGECESGRIYIFWLIQFLILIVHWIKTRYQHKDLENQLFGIAIVINMVIITTIMLMYNVNVGSRHLLTLIIFGVFLICSYCKISLSVFLILLLVVSNVLLGRESYYAQLPYKSADKENQIEIIQEAFDANVRIESGTPWNNTVAYFYVDNVDDKKVSLNYTYLYALPEGMGIQFDSRGLVENELKDVKSKYLLVVPNGTVENKLLENKARLLLSGEDWALYLNPNSNK